MHSTLVLDLDDSLYPEAAYVVSGVKFVARHLADLYGIDCEVALLEEARNGGDWIARALQFAGLPECAKPSLLWLYRLHKPRISLTRDTVQALDSLRQSCRNVVILTDGRSVTQRLKLASLGLTDMPAYISEEWESEKPDPLRFERILADFPADAYIFVGDNPAKDFITPNRLGWYSLGVRLGEHSLYANESQASQSDCEPGCWVRSLAEAVPLVQSFVATMKKPPAIR